MKYMTCAHKMKMLCGHRSNTAAVRVKLKDMFKLAAMKLPTSPHSVPSLF